MSGFDILEVCAVFAIIFCDETSRSYFGWGTYGCFGRGRYRRGMGEAIEVFWGCARRGAAFVPRGALVDGFALDLYGVAGVGRCVVDEI